ncbi:MAG TPA: SagB/ThcOx family dehydrogenase [Kofleriaceae bacterium]|nr:SagB/ThcOx family dehydrogenase [Kofleriaceae bacterium]
MKVNPDLFFKFHDGKFVVWNYRAHEQFELTLPYLERLYAIGTAESPPAAPPVAAPAAQIDAELRAADLVSASYPGAAWGWDSLSQIFHVGTSVRLAPGAALPREDSAAAYLEDCKAVGEDEPAVIPALDGEVFALPAPDVEALKRLSLWDALLARETTREFTGEPIDLGAVSNILWATFGAVHGPDRSDVGVFGFRSYGYRRTSPSGGSLQTAEPYLVNLTISGLPAGVYHYHSIEHRLTRVGELPAADLGPLLAGQNFANDLGFAIFLVARFDKMWWKYPHSRSYRVALMDVGHLSQTFHLVCTGYGLKTWLTAAFYDEEIARRLRLDPARQAVLLMVGAGNGDGKPVSPAIRKALGGGP